MLSTLIAPDIVEYLDTGKIGARSVAGERIIFARPGPELEYWEDEGAFSARTARSVRHLSPATASPEEYAAYPTSCLRPAAHPHI